MKLRSLGLKVQELEAGPYTFLLVDSLPVAYCDRTLPEVPRYYRTDKYFRKGATVALNKWLRGKPVATVPHDDVIAAWNSISRYGTESERRAGRPQGRGSASRFRDRTAGEGAITIEPGR